MNRHERRAREAQQRASRWRAGRPGEVHVHSGYEAAIEQAGGPDKVVTVALAYRGATFKAAVPVDKLDEVMLDMEKAAAKVRAKKCDPRQEAMSWVLSMVRKNTHLTADGVAIATSSLWLAATKPEVGGAILEHAKRGGPSSPGRSPKAAPATATTGGC